jgi:hypothetical protein
MSHTLVHLPEVLIPFYLALEQATELLCSSPDGCRNRYRILVEQALRDLNNAKYVYNGKITDGNSQLGDESL